MRVPAAAVFAAAAVLVVPSVALAGDAPDTPAAPPRDAQPWSFQATAATDVPLDVGARVSLETPFRMRVSTGVGVLPSAYVQTMNALLVKEGAYDQATADLIEAALHSSLVWRTHVGVRPFPKLGLYLDVGYGLVALGGSATGGQLISAMTGVAVPQQPPGGQPLQFDVRSTLHMVDVEVGYELRLVEHLHLRLALGGAFTFAASTSVAPKNAVVDTFVLDQFSARAADYLDGTYTHYVHTPVVSASAGYAF
jgi:hypothetical protein